MHKLLWSDKDHTDKLNDPLLLEGGDQRYGRNTPPGNVYGSFSSFKPPTGQ